VLLMELTKEALLGQGVPTWPDFGHALWFGQFQEILAEQKLTQQDWQLYTCDVLRNPIVVQHNTTNPEVHFVPQITWITMPLDMATLMGDVLLGDSRPRWANYEQVGAALWQEYMTVHSPVVKEILQKIDTEPQEDQTPPWQSWLPRRPDPRLDDLIEKARLAVDSASKEYSAPGGAISASTYDLIRSIYLSVGIGSNTTLPTSPTCVHTGSPAVLV